MKKLPIGIQSFPELINGGYIYVDKTELIHKMIKNKTYFLSRPRRFGKSLLISTLKEIFLGNKEVFKGLWIYDKIEFEKHPVIHISFSTLDYKNLGLLEALMVCLKEIAQNNQINLINNTPALCFRQILVDLSTSGKKVAILIDEYDKPIVDYISDIDQAVTNRDILKSFYSILKDSDEYIQFLFITGVSKFSMVSIFSDLNHLRDISLSEEYASIVGMTETEIINTFPDFIKLSATKLNLSEELLINKLREMYNGYLFNQNGTSVYNPFSVLNFFSDKEFKNYWFSTGTPTFLIESLRNRYLDFVDELPKEVGDDFMDKFDIKKIDMIDIWTLLYQTGYLTLKSHDEELSSYTLDFPNREVKNAFLKNIIEVFAEENPSEISSTLVQINKGLFTNNWDLIVKHLNIIFAGIPYQLFENKYEFFYHSIIHTIISLAGADTLSEVQTSKGRIDCLIRTPKQIYIVEFKMDTPEVALAQIEKNEYFKRFLNDERPKYLIGVGFDKEKREISGWMGKEINGTR